MVNKRELENYAMALIKEHDQELYRALLNVSAVTLGETTANSYVVLKCHVKAYSKFDSESSATIIRKFNEKYPDIEFTIS